MDFFHALRQMNGKYGCNALFSCTIIQMDRRFSGCPKSLGYLCFIYLHIRIRAYILFPYEGQLLCQACRQYPISPQHTQLHSSVYDAHQLPTLLLCTACKLLVPGRLLYLTIQTSTKFERTLPSLEDRCLINRHYSSD